MGSKRKLSSKIIDKILEDNPNCKYIYDLFGGGGAISLEASQRDNIEAVFYNELDTGVSMLFDELINSGVSDWMFNSVSREEFFEYKDEDSIRGGLIKTCWSFGNSGKSYIYGKKIEEDKLLLHDIIVSGSIEVLDKLNKKHNNILSNEDIEFKDETFLKRRLRILKTARNNLNLQRYELQSLQSLERLQSLESLERLERLESLEGNIIVSNLSYEDVDIITPIDETVIYLDPPYKGTTKYSKTIDFDKLYKWIKDSEYKIYISEYNLDDFKVVKEFSHTSSLSATKTNKVVEKLYVNR